MLIICMLDVCSHLHMVAKKLKLNLGLDRSAKDKRLLSMVSTLTHESGLILGLPFEDSDSTGPFCNHFSFLERTKLQKKTLQDHLGGGYTLRATDKTPWTQREADVMDQVARSYLLVCVCVCVCVCARQYVCVRLTCAVNRLLCSACLNSRSPLSASSSSRALRPGSRVRSCSGPALGRGQAACMY
jgi:hypothetical protein